MDASCLMNSEPRYSSSQGTAAFRNGRTAGMCVVALVGFWLFACLPSLSRATSTDNARRILVLYANDRLLPADIEGERGFRTALAGYGDMPLDICDEFLDVHRFSGATHEEDLAAFLHKKYASKPPAVVVVGGGQALEFALRYRMLLFPEAPLVHMGVNRTTLRSIPDKPPDLLGVPMQFDFTGTVEQALRSNPGAKKLVVVTGAAPEDVALEGELRREFAPFASRVQIEFLAGLPGPELASRLRALTTDSVVFTAGYFSDGSGHALFPARAAEAVAAASSAPVYGPLDTFIGTGIVGGHMPSYEAAGYQGGQIVIALLNGQDAHSIALPAAMKLDTHMDWRQLRRWKIDAATLPKDTIVHFREPTVWEAHPRQVSAAAACILALSALAIILARTTAALRASEQRMVLAAQAAKLAMWVWDVPGAEIRGIIASQPILNAYGNRVIKFSEVLAATHPGDRDQVNLKLVDAVSANRDLNLQYRMQTPDGGIRWLAVRGQPDPRSKTRWLGVVLDITEQKKIELKAEQEHIALLHITRVSILGQMLASISHQLNQPLGAILANAQACQQVLTRDPVDLAQAKDISDDIVTEVQRAAEVINRLNALFKRRPMKSEPVDLNALVTDTLTLARPTLIAKEIAVRAEFTETALWIWGDRVQLQQVLLNLLMNAADAMLDTPIVMRRILVTTASAGETVAVTVADNGPGITPENQLNVFEPFWSSKPAGMGIGLSICRSIVLAHHGSLNTANNPSGGAIFSVVLPRQQLA